MQHKFEKQWFRRRSVGFGWRPVSRHGWLITVAAVALIVGALAALRGSAERLPAAIAVLVVYAIVALATGGTRVAETPPVEEVPEPPADETAASGRPVRSRRPRRAAGGPVLVVEHLTKRFGERIAVDDVSFAVDAGEVFGFLGPNGAGKTTTVRMLGTLIAPTSGSAVVAGLPLAAANGVAIRQRIAVMPENPGLYLRLTVTENLEFFAGLYGIGQPHARIAAALDAVNLRTRANDPCGSLSKGLRQRVGLARVLLNDPAIVFLDEPTSGLDPVASREVHDLIDGLRERDVTVFLTTHRLEEAERLCDRVAILNTGLRTIGRTDELRDRLFRKTLLVETGTPLADAARVFGGVQEVTSWQSRDTNRYELVVSDVRVAAPAVARALVAADVDVLSLAEQRHSLEEVYLELIDDDVEANGQ